MLRNYHLLRNNEREPWSSRTLRIIAKDGKRWLAVYTADNGADLPSLVIDCTEIVAIDVTRLGNEHSVCVDCSGHSVLFRLGKEINSTLSPEDYEKERRFLREIFCELLQLPVDLLTSRPPENEEQANLTRKIS